jgi:hypothetical protein
MTKKKIRLSTKPSKASRQTSGALSCGSLAIWNSWLFVIQDKLALNEPVDLIQTWERDTALGLATTSFGALIILP